MVHARTKADGYRPPAYWERIRDIRAAVTIPVIANGEIWSAEDALRCRALSGCNALMLDRGIVADFWQIVGMHLAPHHRSGRLKQWLNFLRRRYPEAQVAYSAVRTIDDPALVSRQLFAHCGPAVSRRTLLAA